MWHSVIFFNNKSTCALCKVPIPNVVSGKDSVIMRGFVIKEKNVACFLKNLKHANFKNKADK